MKILFKPGYEPIKVLRFEPDVPIGTYVYEKTLDRWFIFRETNEQLFNAYEWKLISLQEVPKEIRAKLLLIGE